MSAATFYHIHTTVATTGEAHQSDYWPDGDGEHYAGYVTSMAQYCAEVDHHLTPDNLRLYVVTPSGHTTLISDDDDLKEAVDSLPSRGVLSVTAIPQSTDDNTSEGRKRSRNRNRSGNRNRWNARQDGAAERWYDQESDDSDADDADSDADTDADDMVAVNSDKLHVVTDKKKVGAIMRRFHAHVDDDDGEHDDAPEYPLYREEEAWVRPEVRHLQYILTRLGFMPLDATKQLVGSYQSNTESAVRRFRQHYGIRGGDMTVYDWRTAEKMGEVVRHFRQQGHKHI